MRAAVLAMALVLGASMAGGVVAQEDAAQEDAAADQDATPDVSGDAPPPGTGDDWIDARLDDMDGYAARYRDAFIDEVSRYLEAPRELLVTVLERGMRPGDVYYACALARAAGRACRGVIEAWRADGAGGWQGVSAVLELAPDDGLHARIREDITASYRRWARSVDSVEAASR